MGSWDFSFEIRVWPSKQPGVGCLCQESDVEADMDVAVTCAFALDFSIMHAGVSNIWMILG